MFYTYYWRWNMEQRGCEAFGFMVRVDIWIAGSIWLVFVGVLYAREVLLSAFDVKWVFNYGLEAT